jgi:predicted metal-dependent phosphoesterase TrpH
LLKIELHAHTDADPADRIAHTTRELVDHAASLGYHGLAVTLHDRYFDPAEEREYARERGIVLLPGIELTLDGKHVLLVNFPPDIAGVRSMDEVVRLKRRSCGMVIAPHAFYPTPTAVGGRWLDRHAHAIDAVEINAMYTSWLDFNRPAYTWAKANAKTLVGNTDLHLLAQMGTTYSLVDAPPDPDAICEAVREGRVEICSEPLPSVRAAYLFTLMCLGGVRGRLLPQRRAASHAAREAP